MSGTPEEILAHPEILAVLLPLLRADFALIDGCPRVTRMPLSCPIVASGGMQDHRVSWDDVYAWRKVTTSQFLMEMFPGDHFYLNTARPQLLRSIASQLLPGRLLPDPLLADSGAEQKMRALASCL